MGVEGPSNPLSLPSPSIAIARAGMSPEWASLGEKCLSR
jgi:hypothetical protein